MKRQSLFIKLLIAFLSLTVMMVGLIWFLQRTFLEPYYFQRTEESLEARGNEILREVTGIIEEEGGLSEEDFEELAVEAQLMGSEMSLFDPLGNVLFQSPGAASHSMMQRRNPLNDLNRDELQSLMEEGSLTKQMSGNGESTTGRRGMHGMRRAELSEDAILTYLYDGGYILSLRTVINPLQQGIQRTQSFYWWVILVGALFAVLLSFLFSRGLSKPIVDLKNLAGEMAMMNFDVRYLGSREGEIGELGESLNILTERLKKTIGALEQELEKEKSIKNLRRELVARVSHELKTPIAVIKGYAEALEDKIPETSEEKDRYLSIIQEETRKVDGLLKDIMELSRLESDYVTLEKEPFDLIQMIHRSIEKMKALGPEHQWEFLKGENLSELIINTDPHRLEQVLMNFMKNALDHGEGRFIEVRLKTEEVFRKEGSRRYRVEVKSLGKPIPVEMKEKVWESFFKGGEEQGSGLGLAIAGKLLEAMEMEYGFFNEEDGVCFYFVFESGRREF